ncbi:unnamed protein product [Kuraishia capsulata CBS 1993]|uniref:Autophagy-related protein 3 n=1 Tax=Kuraishia capsulata CBS 1993 TaxID=1382522 RepID=W6MKU9_9ASCO|nr:uncharacterized protein KUCA_T00002993001 [Kuraishia capsulata CBS 1993]CDK27016.1 unnamed protein product [Kuraishia capsulata CBS 1993]
MLRSTIRSWREYLTPVSHESTFRSSGEITPEEFVEAGDYLVYKFPTWQWSPAPESKRKDFLPADKQFLVTRHVPSYARCEDYLDEDADDGADVEVSDGEDGEGWTATHHQAYTRSHCLPEQERRHSDAYVGMKESSDDESANNDIDELIEEDAEGGDAEAPGAGVPGIINGPVDDLVRYYDLYVGYSTSYRVPKMYLVGFDYNGTPLTPDEMFEDISSDYRKKTATIEKAPFLSNTTSVSIHPCKHATVMKVLMNRAAKAAKAKSTKSITSGVAKLGLADSDSKQSDQDDEWEDVEGDEVVRVDQYLIVFLKFISSVTPGIEHDYTMDAF